MVAASADVNSGSKLLSSFSFCRYAPAGRFAGVQPALQAALSLHMWVDIPRSLHSVSALLGSRVH